MILMTIKFPEPLDPFWRKSAIAFRAQRDGVRVREKPKTPVEIREIPTDEIDIDGNPVGRLGHELFGSLSPEHRKENMGLAGKGLKIGLTTSEVEESILRRRYA